jgi:transcriptional regulator with XRE-family HTH domain
MPTIAERLRHLLDTHRRPNGKPWSIRHIVASLNAQGYPAITRNIITALLNGTVTDPKLSHLVALAAFFQVPVTYFFESRDAVAEEEALISLAMQDTHIRRIVVETARLSAAGQTNIVKLYPLVLKLIQEERVQEHPAEPS